LGGVKLTNSHYDSDTGENFEYPGMLFPEDEVVLPQAVTVTDSNGQDYTYEAGHIFNDPQKVQSVIEYTIENNSNSDIIARLNQLNLGLAQGASVSTDQITNGVVDLTDTTNILQNVDMNVSRLLGWDEDQTDISNNMHNKDNLTNKPYGDTDTYAQDGPTWFYFAENPSGDMQQFVNARKLERYGFQLQNMMYNPSAIAEKNGTAFDQYVAGQSANLWSNEMRPDGTTPWGGVPFYQTQTINITAGDLATLAATDPSYSAVLASYQNTGIQLTTYLNTAAAVDENGKVLTDGKGNPIVSTIGRIAAEANDPYTYIYMPAKGKVSVKVVIKLPDYNVDSTNPGGVDPSGVVSGNPGNGVDLQGNAYQYSIFSLALSSIDGSDEWDGTEELVGYGIQNVQVAVNDFYTAQGTTDYSGNTNGLYGYLKAAGFPVKVQ
jgi:hypothetical protein